MRPLFIILTTLLCALALQAQQVVLHLPDGTQLKLHCAEIDSISFHDDSWQDPTGEPNRLPMSFIATGEGHSANGPMKVHIGTGSGTDRDMLWTASDEVAVLQGAAAKSRFQLSQGADTPTGTFSGTATEGPCTVVYPYQPLTQMSDGRVTQLTLPTVQHAVAGSCDSRAALMMADGALSAGEPVALGFRNICSYLAITPTQDLDRVVVSALSLDDVLSGLINVTYNAGAPAWTPIALRGTNKVTLQGPLQAGQTYYVAVLPGVLTQGFRLASFTADGHVISKRVSTSSRFERSLYHDCSAMTSGTPRDYIVDLGLEGTARYWANRNIGAASVTDFGDYFAWGEPNPVLSWGTNRQGSGHVLKTACTWPSYKYGDRHEHGTYGSCFAVKYNESDRRVTLDAADDAAAALWGQEWQMPSKADFEALLTCPHEYTADYQGSGIRGFIFYHKDYDTMAADGQLDTDGDQEVTHLFLPFGGYYENTVAAPNTDHGYYWSKDLSDDAYHCAKADGLLVSQNDGIGRAAVSADFRRGGQNIRPVFVGTLPQ